MNERLQAHGGQSPKSSAPLRGGLLQRKCACGGTAALTGECEECRKRRFEGPRVSGLVQRRAMAGQDVSEVPPIVHEVLRSSGQPLGAATRTFMEPRFGHDFSRVRIHTDARAAESARAVNALAYTVGHNVVFAQEEYRPTTTSGRQLLGHELTHVLQQGPSDPTSGSLAIASSSSLDEGSAERISHDVLAGHTVRHIPASTRKIQRRAAPFIKKVTVHLTPPQSADLQWEGTPPANAPGSDHFTVSTGKGYADIGDPPGTCTRNCCDDPMTQCAPPWNRPDRVGACCTYFGSNFWTGISLDEHNGWKWWTPIQPHYSSRGIALHQYDEVTGQPIGHGCVRMGEPDAKRIHDFSNGRRTNVTIDGRAAPVACDETRRCSPSGTRGALEESRGESRVAAVEAVVPGLEGWMT